MDALTLNEFKMLVEVYQKVEQQRSEDEMNVAIIGAYYTEVFRRQDRSKKLPPIKQFLVKLDGSNKPKQQTPEGMLEQAKLLTGVFGGIIIVND